MHTPLMLFEVRRKRHVVLARQQARRLAGLLGYDAAEQACLAALVFEAATRALRQAAAVVLRFEMSAETFRVLPLVGDEPLAFRVERALPQREPPVGPEDVGFVAARLNELATGDVFEEVERQNQDLLRALVELRACRTEVTDLRQRPAGPSAA